MGYIHNILKYTPSTLYGRYDFLYGEKRKLNYWFKYYLFPIYGRYIFLYDPRSTIILERPLLLERVVQEINLEQTTELNPSKRKLDIEKALNLNRLGANVNIEQGFDLKTQDRKINKEKDFIVYRDERATEVYDSLDNVSMNRIAKQVGLVGDMVGVEKTAKPIVNINNIYKANQIATFEILKDKLFDSVDRIEYTIEQYITYALKSKIRNVNLFATDDIFADRQEGEIALLSDFILETIERELTQESGKEILDSEYKKLFATMKEDITLKRVIEDMYLFELTINKFEKTGKSINIEKDTLKGVRLQSRQDTTETTIVIEEGVEKAHRLQNREEDTQTTIASEKEGLIMDRKIALGTSLADNQLDITNKGTKHIDDSNTQISIDERKVPKHAIIEEKLSVIDDKAEKASSMQLNEGVRFDGEVSKNTHTTDIVATANYKVAKSTNTTSEEGFINGKVSKGIVLSNDVEGFIDEKVPKDIEVSDNENAMDEKVPKDIEVVNNTNFIDEKVPKSTSLMSHESEHFIDDKVPKETHKTDNEEFISHKVPKDTYNVSNENFIDGKVPKRSLSHGQFEGEQFIDAKVPKDSRIVNNEQFITHKAPKVSKVVNNDELETSIRNKATKDILYTDETEVFVDNKVAKPIASIDNEETSMTKDNKEALVEEMITDTRFNFTVPTRDLDELNTDKHGYMGKIPNRELDTVDHAMQTGRIPSRDLENLSERSTTTSKIPSRELDDVDKHSIQTGKIPSRELEAQTTKEINRTASDTTDEQYFDPDVELVRTPSKGINDSQANDKYLVAGDGRDLDIVEEKIIDNDYRKTDSYNHEVVRVLKDTQRKIRENVETRLDMYKRFWFVKQYGQIDFKILPNRDFNYPATISIFDVAPEGNYQFNYNAEFDNVNKPYVVEVYDGNCRKVAEHHVPTLTDYDAVVNGIRIWIRTNTYQGRTKARFDIFIYNYTNVEYMIIRQPKDTNGNHVLYTVAEKILNEKHPIPFGDTLGLVEIELHIPIMVDFINVLLLMWSKFYMAFTGYTGTQAIYGLLNVIHDWLTLDTSLSQNSIEEYHRCFRWLRWEAEKVYNKAKYDPNLSGNLWIEELIYEMVDYMEMHHVDVLPEFNPVNKMDEYRQLFSDPSFDIPVIIDKFKGIRKRVLEKHKRLND